MGRTETTPRRALPAEDPTIRELPSPVRSAIAEIWFGRARSERDVGARFELLGRAFTADSAAGEVRAALAQAARDEAKHSEICVAVGARYGGAVDSPAPGTDEPLVRFGDASESTSLLLHLVLLSCVNEVTSTFYLRECMKRCRSPVARAALRELLADDVQHARIGWVHLASRHVAEDDRRHVSRALPTLLRLSHEAWSSVAERAEPWFVDHGCLGRDAACRAFGEAVRDVMVPGLAFVGVDSAPAARWAERHVPPQA